MPSRNYKLKKFLASVVYSIDVLDSNGKVVRSVPAKRNLVLDQGLNLMASVDVHNLTQVAVVGTGTDPVKRDSGSTTFTRSGTTLTASGNFFSAADVGRLFKMDTGEEMYITAYTDPQNVTVDTSGALGASEGTVWYVNQLGLQTESKRTATLLSGTGNNSTLYSQVGNNGQWAWKRTFIFSAEAGPVTYNEIGWSNSLTVAANLFGRDIISPGVSLLATQQLKVTMTFYFQFGPVVSTPFVNPISGWGADGDYCYETTSNNNTGAIDSVRVPWRPSDSAATNNFILSSIATALTSPATQSGFGLDLSGTGMIAPTAASTDAYVTGSFQKVFRYEFDVNTANRANNRCFGNGNNPGGGQWRTDARFLMDTDQAKTSDYVLRIVLTTSWGRTLVN